MADVVTHHILHEQACQQDTHNRIEQIEVVGPRRIKIAGQQVLDEMNQLLQDNCRHSGADTDHKTDDQYEMLFLDVLLPPKQEAIK